MQGDKSIEVISNNSDLVTIRVPLTGCYAELTPMKDHPLADFRIWKDGVAHGTLTINEDQAIALSKMFGEFADWVH